MDMVDIMIEIEAIQAEVIQEVIRDPIQEAEATVAGAIVEAEVEVEAEAEAEVVAEVEAEHLVVEVEVWIEEEMHMKKKEATLEARLIKIEGEIIDPYQNRDLDLFPDRVRDLLQDLHHGLIKEDIRCIVSIFVQT